MNKLKFILDKQLSVGIILASVLLLSTVIGFGIHLVFAWTGPTASPPNNNVAAPITTVGGQTIGGNLTLSGDLLKSGADGQLAASLDKVFIDTGDSWLRLRTAAGGSTYADFAANTIFSNNRTIQLGSQYLIGDNSSVLDWKSNSSTATGIRLGDLEGTYYGRVYGSGDGAYFGLLDGDGQWSYMATNNTSTDLRIDGASKLLINLTQVVTPNQMRADGGYCIGTDCKTAWSQVGSRFVWLDTPVAFTMDCPANPVRGATWGTVNVTTLTPALPATAKVVILTIAPAGGRWTRVITRRFGSTAAKEGYLEFWTDQATGAYEGGMITQGLGSSQFQYQCTVEGTGYWIVGYIE